MARAEIEQSWRNPYRKVELHNSGMAKQEIKSELLCFTLTETFNYRADILKYLSCRNFNFDEIISNLFQGRRFFFSFHLFTDSISLLIKTQSDLSLLNNLIYKSKHPWRRFSQENLFVKDSLYCCFFTLNITRYIRNLTVSRLRYNTNCACNRPCNDLLIHSLIHSYIHSFSHSSTGRTVVMWLGPHLF